MNRFAPIFLLSATCLSAATLDVVERRWGFDGRVVPERINVLSVEVANVSGEPFDGVLKLHRADAVGLSRGAPLLEPCFLAPGQTKWVQFFPYARRPKELWTLEWGWGTEDRRAIQGPVLGPPARVILHDPLDPLLSRAHFPVLPDGLFPTAVSATDGLDSLLIDHVPRWAPAQKEAFLDWLRRGGQVHVLHDRSGRYPTFAGDLAVLNAPTERFRVGAGLVVRHPLPRDEVSEPTLAQKGFPCTELRENQAAALYDFEEALFGNLSEMTRPRHNWALIYLTTAVYIVLIGPVNYLFGRRRRDYRLTLLFFFATVAGCAYLLGLIGRRGHGEATAVHSLAYARPIDADHYDATQWVNAFVIRGATYDITHDSPHNFYSTCQEFEAVRGSILNGRDGMFRVDIPLYSARAFLHRGKLAGHHLALRVAGWSGDERLEGLVLDYEPGFPVDAEDMWALHRDTFYRLAIDGGRIHARMHGRLSVDAFLPESELTGLSSRYVRGPFGDDESGEVPPEKVFRRLRRLLIGRAVGGTEGFAQSFTRPPPAKDRVQVFIFARSPDTFRVKGEQFGKRMGYVLYHIDLFKPENPNGRG